MSDDFRLEGGGISRSEAVKRFGSSKNVDRLNARGREVGVPPPWHDVEALVAWYQQYYSTKGTVPAWIGKHRVKPVTPEAEKPRSENVISLPRVPAGEASDKVAFFEEGLELLQAEIRAARAEGSNVTGLTALMRQYGDLLAKLQDAKERAAQAGSARELPAERVGEIIDRIHARIPRRIANDFKAVRAAAARAATAEDPAEWARFVDEILREATRRLVETRFADVEAQTPAAA